MAEGGVGGEGEAKRVHEVTNIMRAWLQIEDVIAWELSQLYGSPASRRWEGLLHRTKNTSYHTQQRISRMQTTTQDKRRGIIVETATLDRLKHHGNHYTPGELPIITTSIPWRKYILGGGKVTATHCMYKLNGYQNGLLNSHDQKQDHSAMWATLFTGLWTIPQCFPDGSIHRRDFSYPGEGIVVCIEDRGGSSHFGKAAIAHTRDRG